MKFNVEKLKKMSRPMTEDEKRDIEFRRENREWLAISERLALKLRHILKTEGISQNELAIRMKVTPAQVTQILSGKENLGLKTISKIEKAIGKHLIEVCDDDSQKIKTFNQQIVYHSYLEPKYVTSNPVSSMTKKHTGSYSFIVMDNIFA